MIMLVSFIKRVSLLFEHVKLEFCRFVLSSR